MVRFIDRIIKRPVVVCGLSSGGDDAAWLSAFAAPGQVTAAVYEDAPPFASEANPAIGQGIRQTVAGPMFRIWSKWLGPQWSVGDQAGMMEHTAQELPARLAAQVRGQGHVRVADGAVRPRARAARVRSRVGRCLLDGPRRCHVWPRGHAEAGQDAGVLHAPLPPRRRRERESAGGHL